MQPEEVEHATSTVQIISCISNAKMGDPLHVLWFFQKETQFNTLFPVSWLKGHYARS